MANSSSVFLGKLQTLRANPAAMQRLMLRTLEESTGGEIVIVDPTNPFVFLLESACSLASAAMIQNETLSRKQYASNAVTSEELYRHMADIDYLNRFASPSETVITLLLSLDEIKQKAPMLTDGSGIRRITIPRHTEFNVAGYKFTMQYPVNIDIAPHGGVSVLYDNAIASPIYALETNRVGWTVNQLENIPFLTLPLVVKQVAILKQVAQLNTITGFKRDYEFSDKYYYCRAFIKNAIDSEWVEIKTTHSEQVYDVETPTVVLKVIDNVLRVVVPQVYFNTGMIKDSIRLDIYTTKGSIDVNLSSYVPAAYTINWIDNDAVVDSLYTAPLFTFSGLLTYSDRVVSGGSNGVTFGELREQVISRSLGNANLPITNAQLITSIESRGFDVVTNLDNVTNRQFLATRELPPPSNDVTVSGAGCTILTLQSSLANLALSSSVTDNLRRITILPQTLFKNTGGVLEIMPDVTVANLLNTGITSPEEVATNVNSNNYLYTPFHYVLDTSKDLFETRAYRLDKPFVVSKFFEAVNITVGIEVSTQEWTLVTNPTGEGYILAIQVATSEIFLEVDVDSINVQISYLQPNSSNRVYINGVLVTEIDTSTGRPFDDAYVYHFYLDTTYDVTDEHHLILNPMKTPVALTALFDLIYVIKNVSPVGVTTSDIELNTLYKSDEFDDYDALGIYYGVTHEKLTLKFGDHLEHMWTRSRSVVSESHFLKYLADIPAIYANPVYARDVAGNLIITYDAGSNTYLYTTIHEAGEPVLTVTGQNAFDAAKLATPSLTVLTWWGGLSLATQQSYQAYSHRKDENVLDVNGSPVLVDPYREMIRLIDLVLIDGRYFFATEDSTVEYRDELISQITDWVLVDMTIISDKLLEQTEMFFYPKATIGEMDVLVGAGLSTRLEAAQRLSVEYHMSKEKLDNDAIKAAITRITGEVLAVGLQATTVSLSDLLDALRTALGDDIISVNIKGFANDKYTTITVKDNSVRPSIGKKLVPLSNLTLTVQDDIGIDFISHR